MRSLGTKVNNCRRAIFETINRQQAHYSKRLPLLASIKLILI